MGTTAESPHSLRSFTTAIVSWFLLDHQAHAMRLQLDPMPLNQAICSFVHCGSPLGVRLGFASVSSWIYRSTHQKFGCASLSSLLNIIPWTTWVATKIFLGDPLLAALALQSLLYSASAQYQVFDAHIDTVQTQRFAFCHLLESTSTMDSWVT
jgi:hypothetical protein